MLEIKMKTRNQGFTLIELPSLPTSLKLRRTGRAGIRRAQAFTLIELLVVISVIGLLASVVLIALNSAREKARVAAVALTQRQLQKAVELYFDQMGFYPPDVGRGWDPGFAKPLPYNLDNGLDCNVSPADCPVCGQCPADWITRVQANWRGPYAVWPATTPWNGEYDYNYWAAGTDRYGCLVSPGIYVGAQGDYANANTIPPGAEQELLNKQLDSDGCLNGESQMALQKF